MNEPAGDSREALRRASECLAKAKGAHDDYYARAQLETAVENLLAVVIALNERIES